MHSVLESVIIPVTQNEDLSRLVVCFLEEARCLILTVRHEFMFPLTLEW